MNESIREWLKENVPKCTPDHEFVFRRYYSSGNPNEDLTTLIDKIPLSDLPLAKERVEYTLKMKEKP